MADQGSKCSIGTLLVTYCSFHGFKSFHIADNLCCRSRPDQRPTRSSFGSLQMPWPFRKKTEGTAESFSLGFEPVPESTKVFTTKVLSAQASVALNDNLFSSDGKDPGISSASFRRKICEMTLYPVCNGNGTRARTKNSP